MLTAEFDMDTALRVQKEEGIEEGRTKEKLEIAKQLIDILDISTIAEKTGLPIEIVQKLASSSSKDISTNPYE